MDLDEGSFVNMARRWSPKCNMELGTETGLLYEGDDETTTYCGRDMKIYAKRDIKENEEIRVDYGDSAKPQRLARNETLILFLIGPILHYYYY